MSDLNTEPPMPPPLPPSRRRFEAPRRPPRPLPTVPWPLVVIFAALVVLPGFIWFFCRIEPESGQIAVLIHKTGRDLESGQILATNASFKGIQLDILPEGRYFRNPYLWSWEYHPCIDIPAGKLGVQIRLFGRDLPAGEIIAREGTKGILPEVLGPGKHRINPYAFTVQEFEAITIRPGHIGVKTSLVGMDTLAGNLATNRRNSLLVEEGLKGVVPQVLDPGTHYLNPYMVNVVELNLQSQRFEMSGEDAISFLTADGFTVHVEGTLEFAINREFAALLTHRVGDMDDIVKKVILPSARGFSRIEGSKKPAQNYIVGETRQQFQDSLETHLREKCATWGVNIKSMLIRNIKPPEEIAKIIREREVAVQNAKKFEQQIEQARSKAELTKQDMLALQNKARVEAETAKIRAVIMARQNMSVNITNAVRELDVAKLKNEAAAFQAKATISKAQAEGDVIRMDNESQATVISNQVAAFGTGQNVARYQFYQQIAPRIGTLLTTDEASGFGALFQSLMPPAASPGAPAVRPVARPPGTPPASTAPPRPAPAPAPVPAPPAAAKEVQP